MLLTPPLSQTVTLSRILLERDVLYGRPLINKHEYNYAIIFIILSIIAIIITTILLIVITSNASSISPSFLYATPHHLRHK